MRGKGKKKNSTDPVTRCCSYCKGCSIFRHRNCLPAGYNQLRHDNDFLGGSEECRTKGEKPDKLRV